VVCVQKSNNYLIYKSDILDVVETSTLYQCWNAQLLASDGNEWLMLPKNVSADGTTSPTFWVDDSRIFYKSDKILVRKSYREIARITVKEFVQHPKEEGIEMLLSGSPGTGKSFFARFFLWQLFHPSAGLSKPEMIIGHCCRRGRIAGWIFYKGQFFVHEDIDQFTRSQDGGRLINPTDCWMICDGTAVTLANAWSYRCRRDCPEMRSTSKNLEGHTRFRVFLPTWYLEELEIATQYIYKIPESEIPEIQKRWMKFGGIANTLTL
jgi:hypothetical protein